MITAAATPNDVAGHYDDLDPFYRELWGEHLHHGLWETGRESIQQAVENLVERVASNASLEAGDNVCDVGCGYGATARQLARRHDVGVVGVTLSEAQRAYANAKAVEGVTIRVENWEENSFEDEAFDALLSIECISHVPDKQRYFDQVFRVLRPGKRAVVVAWLADESATRRQIRSLLEPICTEGRLAGMGTPEEYRELIRTSGLRIVEYQDLSRRVRKTWWICARRLGWGVFTRPRYWRFLWQRRSSHSIFLLSVYRILMAYHLGVMRYGLFVIEKPRRVSSESESNELTTQTAG